MQDFCKPCLDKGHQCEAHEGSELEDGIPLCIFCEDGVPCPMMGRKPTALTAPGILAGDKVRRKDGVTEVVPQKHRMRRPRTIDGAIKAAPISSVPAIAWNLSAESESEVFRMKTKQCGHEGCGKLLAAANRSGYCAAHFYDSKRKTGVQVPKRRGRPPKSLSKANGRVNGHGIAGGGERQLYCSPHKRNTTQQLLFAAADRGARRDGQRLAGQAVVSCQLAVVN